MSAPNEPIEENPKGLKVFVWISRHAMVGDLAKRGMNDADSTNSENGDAVNLSQTKSGLQKICIGNAKNLFVYMPHESLQVSG